MSLPLDFPSFFIYDFEKRKMERIDAKDFYKTYKKEYLKWFEEQTGLKALRAEFHIEFILKSL